MILSARASLGLSQFSSLGAHVLFLPAAHRSGQKIFFLSSGREMNFRVPYRGHEILNVRPRPRNTFSISWPLYGSRKFISRPSDKKTVYVPRARNVSFSRVRPLAASLTLGPKGHTRREWYISRPWWIIYYYCPPICKRSPSARIIGQKNAKNLLVWQKPSLCI